MEAKIKNNLSWHGLHRNDLFKSKYVNMQKYIELYEMACKLLHISEENPLVLMDNNEIFSRNIMFEQLLLFLKHIKDFINVCHGTLGSEEILSKLNNFYNELHDLFIEEIKKMDPNMVEFVQLIPIEK